MDFDVVIVGAGAAGLTAAAELKDSHRVLVLDRESFGGQVMNLEWIEDYPTPGERIEGPQLGNQLLERAEGVRMELGEVIEIERYSGCISVSCADGKAYTAQAVILAGGVRPKPLGIPGEDRFEGKGMIHCAFCDAGLYSGQAVAVCGGGDSGLIEALYLAKFASRVHVFEAGSALTASAQLQERARASDRLEVRTGQKVVEVVGDTGVTAVKTSAGETLPVHGVLVHAGVAPQTGYLEGVVPLDERGYVRADIEADAPGLFAAGDIRSGAPRRAAAAIEDGKAVAARVKAALA